MFACRICTGTVLPQLDLGLQPVCNRFLTSAGNFDYKHPLQTGLCQQCGIMQLVNPFPAEELQPKVDWIVYNEPEGHLDNLADRLGKMLPTGALILGVSSKDDSTLDRLQKKGFRTKRFGYADDLSIDHPGAGVETIQGKLTVERARALSQKYGKADAIMVRHILEHVYDIPQFLQAIKELIKSEGYAVFEVPDCTKQFELLDYSTIWEEHLVYFTPETYKSCFSVHGFQLKHLDLVPYAMENSLVAIVQPTMQARWESTFSSVPIFSAHLEQEMKRVQTFSNSFSLYKESLQAYFAKHKPIVFGAGHTACSMISIFELPVSTVIDDNPHKKGMYLPGSKILISGSDKLAPGEVCVLCVNPAVEEKIIAKNPKIVFHSFCPASNYNLSLEITPLRQSSAEVYYAAGREIALDKNAITLLKEKALLNERQRNRICAHKDVTDPVHEMFIVHQRDAYVRPHKHLGKPESYYVLEGEAYIVLFDDAGNIAKLIELGDYNSGRKFYYKLEGSVFHSLLITSDTLVFYETKAGPFNREDTVFASWAPEEQYKGEVRQFMSELQRKVGEKIQSQKVKLPLTISQPMSQPQTHTLVVGGTKGIGRTIARVLAEEGHLVSVLGRSKPLHALENVDDWQADLEKPATCLEVIDKIVAKRGNLTNIIFAQRYRGEANLEKEFAVDVTSTKMIIDHVQNYFAGSFDGSGKGQNSIVIISSVASMFVAEEQNVHYHAAKAALNQLVKYYATTLGPLGIKVNAIAPGTTIKDEAAEFYAQNSDLCALYKKITPLRRMGRADDVARLAAFLCGDDASFITGQTVVIDGGVSLQGQEALARRLTSPKTIPVTQTSNSVTNTTNLSIDEQKKCRLCKSKISLISALASTPIGDAYLPAKKDLAHYPLDLYLCEACGLLQIVDLIDPEEIYRDYIYHTADSLGLVEHFRKYVESVLARIEPSANSLVVEIGSNDGSALQFFKDAGMRVLGIDPAREIAELATRRGVLTLPEFFNLALAHKIVAQQGKASIVMANNVVANIDNLNDIIDGIKVLLASEGVFIFETGYALDLVQKKIFDNIYHEHLSYFSIKPLQRFFHEHGLQLIHVERVPTKGGSIRCTVQLAAGNRKEHASVKELIALEEVLGLHKASTLKQFAAQIQEMKMQLSTLLKGLKSQGKSVAGFGASVGVTTVLYALGRIYTAQDCNC